MRIFYVVAGTLMFFFSHFTAANSFHTEQWLTDNGVQAVFYQAMEVPMLDISLAFAAGSAYDSNQYGLSALTTQMLNEGNAGKDATAIAETLADSGAQFDAASSRDMVVLNLRTLTEQKSFAQATQTFAQIINHPDFPDEGFEREKKQMLMAIAQTEESPDDVATIHFFKTLYKNHPYAHPVNGTAASINALNKKQIIDFYKKYFIAKGSVLVLVGAIDQQTAHQLADKLTRELPKGEAPPAIPQAPQLMHAEALNIPFPSSQTVIRLGQVGINYQNPQYVPLMVGNYILGGGALVSRLAIEVREKQGLTYGINSQFVPMPGNGPFLISFSTKNDAASKALDITRTTLSGFITNGPEANELVAAKQYLTGSFPLSLASNRAIANLLLRMAFYHLPDNYLNTYVARINAVTSEEIKEAFKQQIDPNKLVLITVGHS